MKFKMSVRWGEERIKGFSKPVKIAERRVYWAWLIFWIVTATVIATLTLRKVL